MLTRWIFRKTSLAPYRCDLAGTVEEVGAEVQGLQRGDRVWGCNQGLSGRQGTFAEFAAVDAQWLYPTPASVSDEDAAALALVGITARLGLGRRSSSPVKFSS